MIKGLNRAISFSLIVFLILITLFTSIEKGGVKADDQRLQNAANFIIKRYDPRIGLVSESEDTGSNVPDGTPCYRTFWIYSDNLWASWALKPFNSTIAENISRTKAPYITKYGNANLFEVVLGKNITETIYGKRNVSVGFFVYDGINYTMWADRHQLGDGGVFYDAREYADLCFYLALNCYLNRDIKNATQLLKTGEGMWDNHGFLDKAAKSDGRYQNYKLGLYLFTVKALGYNSSIYDLVESVAWSYQKEDGGIASQSYFNGSIYGTANVETTSALMLAYNQELVDYFRSLQPTTTTTVPTTSTVTVTTTMPTTTTTLITTTATVTTTKTDTDTETVTTTTTLPKEDESDLIIYGLLFVIVILIIALIYSLSTRRK